MTDKAEITSVPGAVKFIDKMGDCETVLRTARQSIGGGQKPVDQNKFIKKLWTDGHTSPFEHVTLSVHITAPLFVARQKMRHRTFSYNEQSGRYSELDNGYYMPANFFQEGGREFNGSLPGSEMRHAIETAHNAYEVLLNVGISREQARMVLPVSTYTNFYMSGNFLNWVKFLKLRHTGHAQFETWFIAHEIVAIIYEQFPVLYEVVKEDINGTERKMATAGATEGALPEGGIGGQSSDAVGSASTYREKVLEALRNLTESGSDSREEAMELLRRVAEETPEHDPAPLSKRDI
jgi:thymidylate synthase (FAD)